MNEFWVERLIIVPPVWVKNVKILLTRHCEGLKLLSRGLGTCHIVLYRVLVN